MGLRRWITRSLLRYLDKPLAHYEQRARNDPIGLRRNIQKADVLLVEGDMRISAIIRYLTQSSWSHAALYIGDELLRRGGEAAERARELYGDEAEILVVEALPNGVVASPLSKYWHLNLRVCRAHGLRREDAGRILDEVIAALGWRYDLQNAIDLARYLIPATWVPQRFRNAALHFGGGQPTEVICSSLIGRLFQGVGFPILPTHVKGLDEVDSPPRRRKLRERLFGYPSPTYTGLFRMRHPTLLTPRDFDLSPYFDIIKFNQDHGERFDYRRMRWADDRVDADGGASPAPPR